MRFRYRPFARKTRRYRCLQHLGDGSQLTGEIQAPGTGINPDTGFPVGEQRQGSVEGGLIERQQWYCGRWTTVIVNIGKEIERNHNRDWAGFTARGDNHCLSHGGRYLGCRLHRVDALAHLPEQLGLIQCVDLKRARLLTDREIADDRHDRGRIEQRFTQPGKRIGNARSRHDAEHTGPTRASSISIGHARGAELMRDEKVWEPLLLERVPQFIFLRARDAVHATDAFEYQGLGQCGGSSHSSENPAEVFLRANPSRGTRGGVTRREGTTYGSSPLK
jgi:hypothetical protein